MSPDEIDDILRCDREYKKGCKKQDIESFFSTTMDMQERKAFLADAMGHIYTELFIGNHRYGYCNRGNGTVEFWRGGCALPGFVDSKNEEKTERNAGYLVVSHSGGGMLRQGTRKGIRRTPANRGMRAHWVVKGLDISEDVCHGMCP